MIKSFQLFLNELIRYARTCVRCDIRREHGRSLLLDHSLLVDSQMGEYILLKQKIEAAAKLADPKEAEFMHLRTLITALVCVKLIQIFFSFLSDPNSQ